MRWRWLFPIAGLLLVVGSCTRLPFGFTDSQPAGPEQFTFDAVPGSGPGAVADDMVRDFGAEGATSNANHRASISTPTGLIEIVTFDSGQGSCFLTIEEFVRGANCGGNLVGVQGWGAGDPWNSTSMGAPEGSVTAVLRVADGTAYTIHLANGFGAAVWPSSRGEPIVVGYFDAAGQATGQDFF